MYVVGIVIFFAFHSARSSVLCLYYCYSIASTFMCMCSDIIYLLRSLYILLDQVYFHSEKKAMHGRHQLRDCRQQPAEASVCVYSI